MKRTLVIAMAIAVAGCGPAAVKSATEAGTTAEPDPASTATQMPALPDQRAGESSEAQALSGDIEDDTQSVEEPASAETVSDDPPTTTTTSSPASTTTTSTLPELGLDLEFSELDELLDELNGLLNGLGSVMNQTEGEITP